MRWFSNQVVTEMLETSQAGSESDLGLSPNGKIKLLKSSSIRLENPVKLVNSKQLNYFFSPTKFCYYIT